MDSIVNAWKSFVRFLAENDSRSMAESLRGLSWMDVLHNPLTWLAGLPLIAYLVLRKKHQLLVLLVTLVLFVALLQVALPPPGEAIPLEKILFFLGGTTVLAGINLYFLFMRDH